MKDKLFTKQVCFKIVMLIPFTICTYLWIVLDRLCDWFEETAERLGEK